MMKVSHLTERQVFFRLGIFFGILVTLLYTLLVVTIKERPDFVARESNPLVPGVRRALRNRPFGNLLGTYVVGEYRRRDSGHDDAVLQRLCNPPGQSPFWLSMLLLGYFALDFSRCRSGFGMHDGSGSSTPISRAFFSASPAALRCSCSGPATSGS